MNLDEFRNAMASDATKENEQLKHEISVLRDQLRDSRNHCEKLRQLMWVLTRGSACVFCSLSMFDCPHAWGNDQIIEAAKKTREETNNA